MTIDDKSGNNEGVSTINAEFESASENAGRQKRSIFDVEKPAPDNLDHNGDVAYIPMLEFEVSS